MIERNPTSKTTRKADKIRLILYEKINNGEIDLGVWTPHRLSNNAILKMYSYLKKKKK